MAFDKKPSTWLGAGYTLASHVLGMNTNDAATNKTLPELTDAEANATTGDIRKVLFAVCEQFYQAYLAQDVADYPSKMRLYRSTSVNDQTGKVSKTYQFQFDTEFSGEEVQSEG